MGKLSSHSFDASNSLFTKHVKAHTVAHAEMVDLQTLEVPQPPLAAQVHTKNLSRDCE